ncbi:MAG TPA: NAD-glutamate dehydrogenase [Motilibacteraceae bacterium]|nr:NAD-glutamate dehydrogenase [Motilibacteraceae bacterium]
MSEQVLSGSSRSAQEPGGPQPDGGGDGATGAPLDARPGAPLDARPGAPLDARPGAAAARLRDARLEEVKADLLARAAELGEHARLGDGDLRAYLERYYKHVAPEDLLGRDPADVLGAATSHRALAAHRPQGTAAVRVFTPTVDEHGWASGHTVVEVVTDDMPFLVDSVTAELSRQGRAIHLVIHPTFAVQRSVTGDLQHIDCTDETDQLRAGGAGVESWMHVEIDRETDREELDVVAADLQRVLRDVREAVEDWEKMQEAAVRVADELSEEPPTSVRPAEVAEAVELLRWLADEHFTFLGYREYALETVDGVDALRAVPGTGLGVLRSDQAVSHSFSELPAEVRAKAREQKVLILTKANSRSTVHRPAYLDYVGVKKFDAAGEVVGERRFLGLFTSAAYTESVQRVPVLRRKVREVLDVLGFPANSHSGKDLLQVLETYPRDELFQVDTADLVPAMRSVLHLQERRQLRLFLRRDAYGRFVSCMVYLPRDRYTTAVRLRMERILRDAFRADSVDYTARVSESVLARLHFVVRVAPGQSIPDVDAGEIEQRLVDATRSWTDDFADALVSLAGEEEAARLLRTYPDPFPEAYKEDFPPRTAVADLRRVDGLGQEQGLAMSLYQPYAALPGERRFKVYRDAPMSLSDVLPALQRMGVEVVDERPYEIQRADGKLFWVYDFGLRYDAAAEQAADRLKELFQDAFAAVWSGAAESDGFNALVLRAGLAWRQAMVLRAYAKYLRQAGSTFSQDYVEQCLAANVGIARLLVRLFEARFSPEHLGDGGEISAGLVEEIEGALDSVQSLDQDRILRSFLGVIRATLRTNYFQLDAEGKPKPYVSFKLDPQQVPDLPLPKPRFEIWVYSPRVEGVHLRFGPVARGGLRWSDRREDFRTEILGLVKAQMVKNAVIVPVGSKGGFVGKRLPDPAVDREAWLAEGIACYRTFISGLLDVTDNLVRGEVVPPERVVRHDGDDTYLVVAADKGTATFSDIANEVAISYGYWLGDAFASGGSVGYDHKAMGITARGAWESVKKHFREMGVDTQTEDFTVVGIGDMSGDVFGNGMLLSEHILLVAAFDHRHIFLDPDPDAAVSYAERRRLFDLPRSSWADYDTSLISAGGGVYPRTAKSIPVSRQVRERLGLPEGTTSLTPAQLMSAILRAPVDLFWNGGIGTYVKASSEPNSAAGDKANDPIRVDGADLRCKVVGEGGNLGLTQLGRIEASRNGVRVNTDAIDNSAGVDTSDHEVNLKILLDRIAADGDLTTKQRNELLASMTDDVAYLVLRDNYEQNVLLGNARVQAPAMLSVHQRFIRELERRGELDRALEFLPSDREIEQRTAMGEGLTSPEFAVLVAYSKITLTEELLRSSLPDIPWFQRALVGYFPEAVRARYSDRLSDHPLRREIIVTCVVNDLVNRAGITFVFRAQEETGASAVEVAKAYTVAREVFDFEDYWRAIEALDNAVPTTAQSTLYLEGRRLIDRAARWLLQNRKSAIDVGAEIARFHDPIQALSARLPELLQGGEAERLANRISTLEAEGVPEELAARCAALLDGFSLLDVVEIAGTVRPEQAPDGLPVAEVAELYFHLSALFEVDRTLTRITALPRGDRWSSLARSALRYDLYSALSGLTANVLTTTAPGTPAERLGQWEAENAEGLARARSTLGEIVAGETFDLATLSVALRTIRTLLRG